MIRPSDALSWQGGAFVPWRCYIIAVILESALCEAWRDAGS